MDRMTDIAGLELSVRTYMTLKRHDIMTVKQLKEAYDMGTLTRLRGVGNVVMKEVKEKLEQLDLDNEE